MQSKEFYTKNHFNKGYIVKQKVDNGSLCDTFRARENEPFCANGEAVAKLEETRIILITCGNYVEGEPNSLYNYVSVYDCN